MVQLSLLTEDVGVTLAERVRRLERAVRASGVDPDLARDAGDAALRRFAADAHQPADPRILARAEAYFHAVIRRRVLRGRTPNAVEARRRLLVTSIEADLRSAGWDAERARAEALALVGTGRAGAA